MSNSYIHFEGDQTAYRRIEIVSVEHLGAGRYILYGKEKQESYEDQLKLEGFNMLGFIYDGKCLYAFYIPKEGKNQIFCLKYNGRWVYVPGGGGRQEQVFTPEGQLELIPARQYKAWQKIGQFHERLPFLMPKKSKIKAPSTDAGKLNRQA